MKLIFLSALVFWQTYSFGQGYMNRIYEAQEFDAQNKPVEALAAFKKAFEISTIDGDDLYHGACTAAETGDKALAFKWLRRAVKQCFIDIEALKSSKSLQSLQQDKNWQPLIRSMELKLAQTDTALIIQLIDIQQTDQNNHIRARDLSHKYGYESDSTKQFLRQIRHQDSLNLVRVTTILDKYGWLGADQIGAWATRGIFLTIQHAELPVQKKYLPMLRAAVQRKQVSKSNLAHLEDRIAVREGRKQLYGTQLQMDLKTQKRHLAPLDAPESVDKRRAKMELEPLWSYLKADGIEWTEKEYPKQK
jgi:hypothetical protein